MAKYLVTLLVFIGIGWLYPAAVLQATDLVSSEMSVEELRNLMEPSVVAIHPIGIPEDVLKDAQKTGIPKFWTGWIFDKEGHVVTSQTLVRQADELKVQGFSVQTHDGTLHAATMIGRDPVSEIVILKFQHADLHPAKISKDAASSEDKILCVGFSEKTRLMLNHGKVSKEHTEGFISTTAELQRAQVGGPLTNVRGEVVGVVLGAFVPDSEKTWFAAAIPISKVKRAARLLIKHGHIPRPSLGVGLTDAPVGTGALVNDVVKGASADRAGVKSGDIITAMDGNRIENAKALVRHIGVMEPEDVVTLSIVRADAELPIRVPLGESPSIQRR